LFVIIAHSKMKNGYVGLTWTNCVCERERGCIYLCLFFSTLVFFGRRSSIEITNLLWSYQVSHDCVPLCFIAVRAFHRARVYFDWLYRPCNSSRKREIVFLICVDLDCSCIALGWSYSRLITVECIWRHQIHAIYCLNIWSPSVSMGAWLLLEVRATFSNIFALSNKLLHELYLCVDRNHSKRAMS
jgi:hypothetical protein